MGISDTSKWPVELEHRGRDPKEDTNRLKKEGDTRF
jgi:hypothetical protein